MTETARDDARLYAKVETFFRESFGTDNPLITEAVRRMLAAGGKRLRPRITLLAAEACGGRADEHLHLAAYMELIHVATLIHDDVVDNAATRRGVNATAVDFGNRVSVLAGDYLFAWIFKNVTAGYQAPIPHILSATLADICDGEVLQLRSLGALDLPLATYVEVARKKTAALFAASAACGSIASGGTAAEVEALRSFGDLYGVAFQMKDDLLDMTGDEKTLGKPVGNDLRERKMTAPLILGLGTGDGRLRSMVERYYGGEGGDADIPAILDALAGAGAFAATAERIDAYASRAKAALAPMGASEAKAELGRLADSLSA